MKIVGLMGGSSVCELGPAADVELFFTCIQSFAASRMTTREVPLLTDRLYRRYLRSEEVELASSLMNQVREVFERTPTSAIDLRGMKDPSAVTRLDPSARNLSELFSKYFECFQHCMRSSELFFETWKIFQPIRLVLADTLDFVEEKKRPLVQYDLLQGRPFWLRQVPSLA